MRRLGSVMAIGLFLAGCTAAGSSPSFPSGPGATATPLLRSSGGPHVTYQLPGSADALVLRIDTDGGLIPPGAILTHVAELSVYADGRVVEVGPVDAMYPGPLLPDLRELRLTAADLQDVLAAADQAGLLGANATHSVGGVADAPTTVFTTTANGSTHTVSAYALGIDGGASPGPEAGARARLEAFRTTMTDLGAFLGRAISSIAYAPTEMRLLVGTPIEVVPPMTQTEIPWPLGRDPLNGIGTSSPTLRCMTIKGADLETFLETAKSANAITTWVASSGRYSVAVRPLLPDESGC